MKKKSERVAKAMMIIIGIALVLTDTGAGITTGSMMMIAGICVGDWEDRK